jgi:hypothetical protein
VNVVAMACDTVVAVESEWAEKFGKRAQHGVLRIATCTVLLTHVS